MRWLLYFVMAVSGKEGRMDRSERSKRHRAKALMVLLCTANLQRLMLPKR